MTSKMSTNKDNIGKQFTLPVLDVITIKDRKSYIVQYGETRCRIPLFEWQYDMETPIEICCRLIAVNDFGYPIFEQVAQQRKINIKEPANSSELSDRVALFREKYGSKQRLQKEPINGNEGLQSNKSSECCEHDITYYIWSEQEEDFDKWLISTGGIKVRYEILIAVAKFIAQYHRENKVYKDFSPLYIGIKVNKGGLVSVRMPETHYVVSGLGNMFVYASHGAPEIVTRRIPNTPMSDCFTFAILTHQLLAFCHPFIGDIVKKNLSIMEDAFKGKLPWIDNQRDKSNILTRRRYDCLFTTPEIRCLFKRTFEDGLDDMMARPSVFEWIDALENARDNLKYCSRCNTDYLYFEEGVCALCDDEPHFDIRVEIARIEKKFNFDTYSFSDTETELYPEATGTFFINRDNSVTVKTSHILLNTSEEHDILSIRLKDKNKKSDLDDVEEKSNVSIILKPLNGYSFFAATKDRRLYTHKISSENTVEFKKGVNRTLVLALDDINIPQRVIVIKMN